MTASPTVDYRRQLDPTSSFPPMLIPPYYSGDQCSRLAALLWLQQLLQFAQILLDALLYHLPCVVARLRFNLGELAEATAFSTHRLTASFCFDIASALVAVVCHCSSFLARSHCTDWNGSRRPQIVAPMRSRIAKVVLLV